MALTPMMQQYLETKEKCKDCILFFRLGDFYEMFFEDAEIASKEIELVLTGRDCGLENRAPMCGLPYHAAESYIARLVEKGYKVAICEQVEDPALAKGIVKREIIRIVTPGTILEGNLLDEKKNNYIASILINNDGFALAACDISTGEFLTTEVKDNPLKIIDELSKYTPSEILVVNNKKFNCEKIIKELTNKLNFLITYVDYNDNEVDEFIAEDFNNQLNYLKDDVRVSAKCLYNYLAETQKSSLGHILEIKKYEVSNFMTLDSNSRRNLELTETIRQKSRKGSLLWILDHTQTAMGGRLIRKWIEEPLLNETDINKRYDVIEELNNNIYLFSDLRGLLKNVYDIERLISKISCNAANPRDLVALKNSLINLPDIKAVIESCKSKMLVEIYKDFDTLDDLYSLIDAAIDNNPSMQLKEGGIIKLGYNKEVDKLRSATTDGKKWIAELEQKEKDTTGIRSLKVGFNKVFGYYIEVTKSNLSNVPEDRYIRKQTLANGERYITQELKEMEDTILGAEQKIVEIEYELFCDIRSLVAKEVHRVQKTAYYISVLDVLASFAKAAFENNYVRPVLNQNGIVEIKEGRHPVVEKVIQGLFVPNDTYLDLKNDKISIITGPNMAGKSTYMRQVALILLMAQIGCFVPADEANIAIVDRIFTRIGASDDLSSGQSTFMVEMAEVSNILRDATKNSLVILDEVGRGTSTFDGLSIAWSVVEYINNKIGAKTLFATHYHELTELEGKLPGVKNYEISVKEHGDDIIFLRKIIRGGADRSYGIQVAKLAGLPEEVVSKAKTILLQLSESDINKNINLKEKSNEDEAAATTSPQVKCKETLHQISLFDLQRDKLIDEIKSLNINSMTPMDALNYLYNLIQRI